MCKNLHMVVGNLFWNSVRSDKLNEVKSCFEALWPYSRQKKWRFAGKRHAENALGFSFIPHLVEAGISSPAMPPFCDA